MTNVNLVSVVINCFNGEKFLNQSVKSVLNQSYTNWELIFWDNCSTDNTKLEFNKISDHRFRYYLSTEHTSQYEARNQAVVKCKGEFIAFLDVDDWWSKTKLERQISLFEDNEIGFSSTNAWIINERRNNRKSIAFKNIPNGNVLNNLLKKDFVTMSSLMIRKSIYNLLDSGFNPKYEIIGDFDLVLRLAQISKFKSIQEPLVYYRQHQNNLTFVKIEKNIRELIELFNDNENNLKINKSKNFYLFKNNIIFSHALMLTLESKRLLAFKKILEVTNIRHFLKFLLIFILPKGIIRKIRSR